MYSRAINAFIEMNSLFNFTSFNFSKFGKMPINNYGKLNLDNIGTEFLCEKALFFLTMEHFWEKFMRITSTFYNFEKAHFLTMDIFWEKFMRSTSNSEYDILRTVHPDHEDLIRIWIIRIQNVPLLELAPFCAFNMPYIVVFQNVPIIGTYRHSS